MEAVSTIRPTIRSGARRRNWIFRSRCTEVSARKMPTMGADRYRDPFFFHMVCHPFEQQAACMDIICGGVLAKFPRLKIAFLESGIGWLGYWLDRMDGHFEKMGTYVPWLKKRPREYFLEQCYLTMDPDESTLGAMVGLGVERNVLWGSDYPHFDCIYPGVLRRCVARSANCPNDPAQHPDRQRDPLLQIVVRGAIGSSCGGVTAPADRGCETTRRGRPACRETHRNQCLREFAIFGRGMRGECDHRSLFASLVHAQIARQGNAVLVALERPIHEDQLDRGPLGVA